MIAQACSCSTAVKHHSSSVFLQCCQHLLLIFEISFSIDSLRISLFDLQCLCFYGLELHSAKLRGVLKFASLEENWHHIFLTAQGAIWFINNLKTVTLPMKRLIRIQRSNHIVVALPKYNPSCLNNHHINYAINQVFKPLSYWFLKWVSMYNCNRNKAE